MKAAGALCGLPGNYARATTCCRYVTNEQKEEGLPLGGAGSPGFKMPPTIGGVGTGAGGFVITRRQLERSQRNLSSGARQPAVFH